MAHNVYLLEPSNRSNPASLWDYTEERAARFPHWVRVIEVRFADGSVGFLPETQAVAVQDVVEMFLDDEIQDFENCGEEAESGHIVHALRSLNTKPE